MNLVRVVVVGCGNMGSSHARAYTHLQGFKLVGLVDRSPEKAQSLSAALGGVSIYSSLGEATAAAHPDAAAICTYPETHHALATGSLDAGLHVFVEKPLAVTVEQAEEIARAAEKMKKKVVVGYILRHHPAWQRFIEEARQLGKPLLGPFHHLTEGVVLSLAGKLNQVGRAFQ
jgi:predicted dehydrogenase